MNNQRKISRRSLLLTAGCGAGLAALATRNRTQGAPANAKDKALLQFENQTFHDNQNRFLPDQAKDAIIRLCKYHGYPLFPGFKENLWVSDYGRGQFAKLGLAAYIFDNNQQDRYMLLDFFLLPRQMLAEHWHVEGEGNPAKLEGWLVRWGLSHVVGVGEPNLSAEVRVPQCHWGGKTTTQHEVIATPGRFVRLAKVGTPHWQYAGPEGVIITEVANVHTHSAVRHSDPAINKHFLDG